MCSFAFFFLFEKRLRFFIAFICVGFFDPSISFFSSEVVFDQVKETINTHYS